MSEKNLNKDNLEKVLKLEIEMLKLNIQAKQLLLENLLEDEDDADEPIEE